MANFDDQVMALTGLTINGSSTAPSQAGLTQFLTDGAKDVINSLSKELKEKCMKITNLYISNTNTTFDLDDAGQVLYVTRENANSGYFAPCRQIKAMFGDLTNDSGNIIHYATATDPVYYVESNSSGIATLFVKPTPTELQPAKVYHISYPSVAYNVDAIANFPNEAEHLVALYGAMKSLQNAMGALQTNSDITDAFTAANTAIDQASTAADKFISATESVFGDADTFDAAASQLTRVKNALNNAENVINGDQPTETTDAFGALVDEDIEILQGALSIVSAEIQRAQMHLSEWTSIGDMRVKEINAALSEAQGYVQEINARVQRDTQKYDWYAKNYTVLQQEYIQGLSILRGTEETTSATAGGGQ
jgi:hypothetical protein